VLNPHSSRRKKERIGLPSLRRLSVKYMKTKRE
jgi:hypothetical protein